MGNDKLVGTLKAAGFEQAAALAEAYLSATPDGQAAPAQPPQIGSVLPESLAPQGTPIEDAPAPFGSPLTLDQVKGMDEQQINENWEEVQKVLAATGSGS